MIEIGVKHFMELIEFQNPNYKMKYLILNKLVFIKFMIAYNIYQYILQ